MVKIASSCANGMISYIRQMQEEVQRRCKEGQVIVDMTIGAPNHRMFDEARQAAHDAIDSGMLESYAPIHGITEVRETIARFANQMYGSCFSVDNVGITNAGTQAIYNAIRLTVEKGDRVLTTTPIYPLHYNPTALCGGELITIETVKENGFVPTGKQIADAFRQNEDATGSTKITAVIFDYPNNPTGAVLTKAQAKEIADTLDGLLDRYPDPGFALILDEVYLGMCDDRHTSLYTLASERLKESTILVFSGSKVSAQPGARIGATLSSTRLAQLMKAIQGATTNAVNGVAQRAFQSSLEKIMHDPQAVVAIADNYRKKTRYVCEQLNHMAASFNLNTRPVDVMPGGAIYVFADFSYMIGRKIPEPFCFSLGKTVIESDVDIAHFLLEMGTVQGHAGVGVVPGCDFRKKSEEGFVRLTCTANMEMLEKALRSITQASALLLGEALPEAALG